MATLVPIDPIAPDHEAVARAAAVLAAGGVVAYPTETFYGLAADPRLPSGVAAIFRAKARPEGEALPLVASDEARLVALLGPLPPLARRLAGTFWPGPLTLVIPVEEGRLASGVSQGLGTVAVRVPSSAIARALAAAAGGLVTSTSANRSGRAPATTAHEVMETIGPAIDLVLDGGASPGGAPSTIVDVCGAQARLIREGRVPYARVLESLQ